MFRHILSIIFERFLSDKFPKTAGKYLRSCTRIMPTPTASLSRLRIHCDLRPFTRVYIRKYKLFTTTDDGSVCAVMS